MNAASQASHEGGKQHTAQVAAQAAPAAVPVNAPVAPTNTSATRRQARRTHPYRGQHTAQVAAQPATAAVPANAPIAPTNSSATSRRQARSTHPNGKRLIPIHSVAKVHNHVCEIPLDAYGGRGRSSMVTVEEVEAASDDWDARGILHDIDTQWGMIPGGGAYKESNHYYGPGEYDFY